MKPNTRLLRRPLGRPRTACTLCTLNTSCHSAKKTKAHSSLAMLQECLCNSWGDLQPHPHMNTERGQIHFLFSNWKNNTLQLKQQAWSHFSKSCVKSVVNTSEESSRTFIWTWSSFFQGPDALQSYPLWPHMKTSSLYFATYSSLKSLKEKLKLTKCLEK